MQSSREAMLVSQSKALLIWLGKNQPNEIIYLKTLSKVVRCFFFFFYQCMVVKMYNTMDYMMAFRVRISGF